MFDQRIELPGSHKEPPPRSEHLGKIPDHAKVTATIVLRHGMHAVEADIADLEIVEDFAIHFGLLIVDSSLRKRRVIVTGTAAAMARAFNPNWSLYWFRSGNIFRVRTGTLTVPSELRGVVVAVLGLDDRPVAKPHYRANLKPRSTSDGTFTPPQLAGLYNFPKLTGAGQTVGIIELGGGYDPNDLRTYFTGLGLNMPKIVDVSVDGGQNTMGSDADGEVQLDIEVVGAVANGADIAVYFAPNTDQGFVNAISDALHDQARKVSVVSISWGGPEDSWTAQARTAMNAVLQDAAALGVTVTVASGDNGSSDGVGDGALHVDFPASSPFALACGGTAVKAAGSSIASESVWNETATGDGAGGGGISQAFPRPPYQANANVPKHPATGFAGRGVPDVAGNADPVTGYRIRVDGQDTVIGGTSAVAPLWAGLIALMNQSLGEPVGFVNPKLYTLKSGCNDVTIGNNDDAGLGSYNAGSGWDACTGLGSPNGQALLAALRG